MRSTDRAPRALEFAARCVSLEDDPGVWRVAFADAEYNARRSLLLERAAGADDDADGDEGYRVELNGRATVGGIASFELHRDHARVRFDDDAAAALGGVGAVVAAFALRERQFEQLRDRLARIFAGDDCLRDASVG